MANEFQQSGVEMVVKDLQSFERDLGRANTAIDGVGKRAEAIAKPLGRVNDFFLAGLGAAVGTAAINAISSAINTLIDNTTQLVKDGFKAVASNERITASYESLLASQIRMNSGVREGIVVGQERVELTKKEQAELAKLQGGLEGEIEKRERLREKIKLEELALATLQHAENTNSLAILRKQQQLEKLRGDYDDASGAIDANRARIEQLTAKSESYADVVRFVRKDQLTMNEALAQANPLAEELVKWNTQLAIRSPFSEEGVAAAMRTAQAYGFTALHAGELADETDRSVLSAQRVTIAAGDTVAAMGLQGDAIDRIVLALGQMQAKGKISAQEINQLAETGIPVREILAESFGVTVAQIMEMGEQGELFADEVVPLIVRAMEEQFGGAMQRQSKTVDGLVNSLADIKQVGLREFFTATVEAIKPQIESLVDLFARPETMAKIRALGDQVGIWVGEQIPKAIDLAVEAWNFMRDETIPAVQDIIAELKPLAADALNQVGQAVQFVMKNWDALVAGVKVLAATIATVKVISVIGSIATAIGGVTSAAGLLVPALTGAGGVAAALAALTGPVGIVVAALGGLGVAAAVASGVVSGEVRKMRTTADVEMNQMAVLTGDTMNRWVDSLIAKHVQLRDEGSASVAELRSGVERAFFQMRASLEAEGVKLTGKTEEQFNQLRQRALAEVLGLEEGATDATRRMQTDVTGNVGQMASATTYEVQSWRNQVEAQLERLRSGGDEKTRQLREQVANHIMGMASVGGQVSEEMRAKILAQVTAIADGGANATEDWRRRSMEDIRNLVNEAVGEVDGMRAGVTQSVFAMTGSSAASIDDWNQQMGAIIRDLAHNARFESESMKQQVLSQLSALHNQGIDLSDDMRSQMLAQLNDLRQRYTDGTTTWTGSATTAINTMRNNATAATREMRDRITADAEQTKAKAAVSAEDMAAMIEDAVDRMSDRSQGAFGDMRQGVVQESATMRQQSVNEAQTQQREITKSYEALTGDVLAEIKQLRTEGSKEGQAGGESIAEGVGRGIDRKEPSVVGKMVSFAKNLWSSFMSAIGAHSPSRLFMEAGDSIVDGILVALNQRANEVNDAVAGLLDFSRAVQSFGTATAGMLKGDLDPLTTELERLDETLASLRETAGGDADPAGLDAEIAALNAPIAALTGQLQALTSQRVSLQSTLNFFKSRQPGTEVFLLGEMTTVERAAGIYEGMIADINARMNPLQAQRNELEAQQRALAEQRMLQAEILALEHDRARVAAQVERREQVAGRFEAAQEQLGFLEQQRDFIEFLRSQGMDPHQILGDVRLGFGADPTALTEAMAVAMEQLAVQLNRRLFEGPQAVLQTLGERITEAAAGAGIAQAFAARLGQQGEARLQSLDEQMAGLDAEIARLDDLRAAGEKTATFEDATGATLTSNISIRIFSLMNQMDALEEERAALLDQQRRDLERIVALQEKQAQFDFLKQQLDLVEQIRRAGLNPAELLQGVTLGVDANLSQIIEASVRVLDAMVAQASQALNAPAALPAAAGAGGVTNNNTTFNVDMTTAQGSDSVLGDIQFLNALYAGA